MGLTRQLHQDADVLFAGYKVPHPLRHNVVVKVQTNHNSSPVASMTNTITDLLNEFNALSDRFNAALEKFNPGEAYFEE